MSSPHQSSSQTPQQRQGYGRGGGAADEANDVEMTSQRVGGGLGGGGGGGGGGNTNTATTASSRDGPHDDSGVQHTNASSMALPLDERSSVVHTPQQHGLGAGGESPQNNTYSPAAGNHSGGASGNTSSNSGAHDRDCDDAAAEPPILSPPPNSTQAPQSHRDVSSPTALMDSNDPRIVASMEKTMPTKVGEGAGGGNNRRGDPIMGTSNAPYSHSQQQSLSGGVNDVRGGGGGGANNSAGTSTANRSAAMTTAGNNNKRISFDAPINTNTNTTSQNASMARMGGGGGGAYNSTTVSNNTSIAALPTPAPTPSLQQNSVSNRAAAAPSISLFAPVAKHHYHGKHRSSVSALSNQKQHEKGGGNYDSATTTSATAADPLLQNRHDGSPSDSTPGYVFKGNRNTRIAVDNDLGDSDGDDDIDGTVNKCVPKFLRTRARSDGVVETFFQRMARVLRRGLYVSFVFLKLSMSDAGRRKGSFCLGLSSVIMVVFIAAIMFTTLNNLQIIFLKLGEGEEGEIDLLIEPGGQVPAANSLNYNVMLDLFQTGDTSYHTPRTTVGNQKARFVNPWAESNATVGRCEHPLLAQLPPDGRGTVAVGEVVWSNSTEAWSGWDQDLNECEDVDCAVMTMCPLTAALIPADVYFIDGPREERMQLGKAFPATFPDPLTDEDGAIIDTRMASVLGVAVGDRFLAAIDASYPLMQAYQEADLDDLNSVFDSQSPSKQPMYTTNPIIVLSLKVHAIVDKPYGKLASDSEYFVMISYGAMTSLTGKGLSTTKTTPAQRLQFQKFDPNTCAENIIFNFPPDVRTDKYVADGYDTAQKYAYDFAGRIVAPIGFNQIDSSLPLLSFLYGYRFFSLFLSLLIWIIIAALSFLSVVLIYSLLTINIESRTYELGVMRMEGFARQTLAGLVIIGALLFAIPGWVLGLVLGQIAYIGVRALLQSLIASSTMSVTLSANAVGFGTLAGLGIPLAASLAPVMSVLTQLLPDALNTERGRTKAIDYEIERDDDTYFSWTVFGLGLLLSIFGFLIYYLFPLALINFDLSLLFFIFFAVLLGMLGGLILLAVNFERFAETIIQYVFLFWENDAVFLLIERNLTAHRPRNRKTTLMFALSLGFVIFISVAFNIQMISVSYGTKRSIGNDVLVSGEIAYDDFIQIDMMLSVYKDYGYVKHYTYDTAFLQRQDEVKNASIGTVGRFVRVTPIIRGIAPNFFENTDDSFLVVRKQFEDYPNGLSLGEQLYTVEGSSRMILPTSYIDGMGLDNLDDPFELFVRERDHFTFRNEEHRHAMSTSAFIDASPVLTFSKFPNPSSVDAAMSIPSLIGHSYGGIRSVRSLEMHSVSISTDGVKNYANGVTSAIRSLLRYSENTRGSTDASVTNYFSQASDLDMATQILSFFFIFTQIMATAICFFALLSSMSTNVLHQAKEIGVMRCLGLKSMATYRLYIWEAFVLVFAASIMGLVVGTIVAYTMLLQNALFTQLPLPFAFPYVQLVIVVGTSAFCAFFASFGPVKALLSMPSITHILRRSV